MTMHLGVLAASPHIRYAITTAVAGLPYTIACTELPDSASVESSNVDIWLLAASDYDMQVLASIKKQRDSRVLVLEEDIPSIANAGFHTWQQKLEEKLAQFSKQLVNDRTRAARHIWLLAASTGGLNAVASFLKQVPHSFADVGFVYAQHIGSEQAQHLADVVERATGWYAYVAGEGDVIRKGRVAIISPAVQTRIGKDGRVELLDMPWSGLHQPSINHLAADLARGYSHRSGMIVFTGMGDDGARGSRFINRAGGQVWVQSPESCVAASMPVAVINQGRCHALGTVDSLAEKIKCHYAQPESRFNSAKKESAVL